MYGFNGVTIRNNVVANCFVGIQFTGSTSPNQPADHGYIFNNTIYNVMPGSGLQVDTNVANTVVENNFAFSGADPRGFISSSGVVADFNAHDGLWISASEGPHTLALSTTAALLSVVNATTENFHLVFGAPLIGAAEPQDSFFDDFDVAFAAMTRERPDALFLVTDALTTLNRKRVLEFAAQHRIESKTVVI